MGSMRIVQRKHSVNITFHFKGRCEFQGGSFGSLLLRVIQRERAIDRVKWLAEQ
jgi:hypothetical protein